VKQWSALNRDVEDCHVLLELLQDRLGHISLHKVGLMDT
jgi:hypothetical protein